MSDFKTRMKELRKELGLTQEELGAKFHLNKSSISKYEKGIQTPDMESLMNISNFFNVSLDYLIGVSNIKNPKEIIYSNAFHSISDNGLTKEDIDIVKAMIEQLKKKNK